VISEIPLTPKPQYFNIDLAKRTYRFVLAYRNGWTLDVYSTEHDPAEPIILGLPLVTGVDILSQYQHLGIGGALVILSDSTVFAEPTRDNLGQATRLYFVTDD